MRLAAEVRNRIYEDVFDDVTIDMGATTSKGVEKMNQGILYACKQTRHEAEPLYFSCTSFRFRNHDLYASLISKRPEVGPSLWTEWASAETADTISTEAVTLFRARPGLEYPEEGFDLLRGAAREAEVARDGIRAMFRGTGVDEKYVFGCVIESPVNFSEAGKFSMVWTCTPVETLEREFEVVRAVKMSKCDHACGDSWMIC